MPNDEGRALISELDEDERVREVYARFGLAVFFAQVFEAGVVNLIFFSERLEGRWVSDEEIDRRFDELYGHVLGKLVRMLESQGRLPEPDLDLCRQALKERNRLAHRFWREAVENFMTPRGMQRLLDDVDGCRALFVQADEVTTALLHELGSPHGLTPEAVEQQAERIREQVRLREGSPKT
jgi:hypothetical protein